MTNQNSRSDKLVTLDDDTLNAIHGGEGGLLGLLGLPEINLLNGLDLNVLGISNPLAGFFGGQKKP